MCMAFRAVRLDGINKGVVLVWYECPQITDDETEILKGPTTS